LVTTEASLEHTFINTYPTMDNISQWFHPSSTVGRQWKVAPYFGFQSSKPQIWNHEAWSGDA
jgi:hypothetical protein